MFKNVRLKSKLIGGYLVVASIVAIVALVGYFGMRSMNGSVNSLHGEIKPMQLLSDADTRLYTIRGDVYKYILIPQLRDETEQTFHENIAELDKQLALYQPTMTTREEKAAYSEVEDSWKQYQREVGAILAQVKAGDEQSAVKSLRDGAAQGARKKMGKAMHDLIETSTVHIDEAKAQAGRTFSGATLIAFTAGITGVLIALALGFLISRSIGRILKSLTDEAERLTEAATNGRLDVRGDLDNINFEFRGIVKGMNETLDAVTGPLHVAAEYVARISKGDVPPKITENYKGDFNEIKNNLNTCIDSINALVADANMLAGEAVEGRLGARADSSRHQGDFKKVVDGVNNTMNAIVGPLSMAADYVERISKGDIPPRITDNYKGDFNDIKDNLNRCIDAVNELIFDTEMLVQSASEGRLFTRADAVKHKGDFRKLIEGVNSTVATFVGHLDDIPTPLMITDREFNIQYMNKNGAEIVGRSQEQLVGQKCYDQFRTTDCHTSKCALGRAMSSGKKESSEAAAHPAGLDLEISYTGVPVTDRKGNIIGAMEIVVDQTKVKNLMKVADQKVHFLDNIPTPVMAIDKDFNVMFVNSAGARAVGRSVSDCIGQKCSSLFNTGHCNTSDCAVGMAMRQNSIVTNDTIARLPSGALPIRYTGAPLKDSAGNVVGGLEYVVDISKEVEITNGIKEQVAATVEGRLNVRSDMDKYQGNYREIVKNVNSIIDAFVEPIELNAEYVKRISRGDIPEKVTAEYKGDFNEMKNSLNACIDNLTRFAVDVQTAAEQVSAGSQEVSSSAQQLSQGSTEQATNVEEVSSSMEEMNGMVSQNSDNARQTASIAEKAATDAEEGGTAVSQTVHAMKSIAEKIGIIEEIARQTNMLALNAAIEAARAGEHGKGFAVVAAEVRKLAERSQTAAKEIGSLSSSSVEIAVKAGKLLDEIVPGIRKTAELVQEINASSSEQASGIEGVTQAIQQLDQVIQQNAGAAEQMASTSEELSGQAEHLKETAAFFRITGREQAEAAAPQRAEPSPAKIRSISTMRHKPEPKYAKKSSAKAAKAAGGIRLEMGDVSDSDFERY